MTETSTANIKQIITEFYNIITIYENPQWVKTVTSEDIKVAFKLGSFIEKTMCKFSEQNCTDRFIDILKVWGDSNKKHLNYDKKFYLKMCDHLLLKFFKHKTVNENVIDVAVRMYTSLFPKERLQHVLKDLIMTSASYEAIFEFSIANKTSIDVNNLKYELILQEWCKHEENMEKLILESLSSFKVETSLPTLIGVLSLNVNNQVTKLILYNITEKMLDRSILSKFFWLTLFKKVDQRCLIQVCLNYQEFLESFCNFLIYIGGMMEEVKSDDEKVTWISNPDISLCPEITFPELETYFISLSQNVTIKNYVINRLNESLECTGCSIWESIRQKCL